MILSWIFLFLFIALILIIIEISTLILESTGLAKQVARFQAISLLTGTGYTTSEAELITKHPVRRKVAEILIIFGAIAFAVIIAIFFNFINQEFVYTEIIVGIGLISFVFLFFRLRWVQKSIVKKMNFSVGKYITLRDAFSLDHDDEVVEITLDNRHQHLFFDLKTLNLSAMFDIHILTIQRSREDGEFKRTELIKQPSGSTKLMIGDKILAIGSGENIRKMFRLTM